jgi:hypothetical protein
MSDSSSSRFITRRRTLLAAIGTTPVAAAVLLTQRQRLAQAVPLPDEAAQVPDSAGYHETEHIRKYYRSVEF